MSPPYVHIAACIDDSDAPMRALRGAGELRRLRLHRSSAKRRAADRSAGRLVMEPSVAFEWHRGGSR